MRGNNREIDVYVDTFVCPPPTTKARQSIWSRRFLRPSHDVVSMCPLKIRYITIFHRDNDISGVNRAPCAVSLLSAATKIMFRFVCKDYLL